MKLELLLVFFLHSSSAIFCSLPESGASDVSSGVFISDMNLPSINTTIGPCGLSGELGAKGPGAAFKHPKIRFMKPLGQAEIYFVVQAWPDYSPPSLYRWVVQVKRILTRCSH